MVVQGRRSMLLEHRVFAERALWTLGKIHSYAPGHEEYAGLVCGLASVLNTGACNVVVVLPLGDIDTGTSLYTGFSSTQYQVLCQGLCLSAGS